MTTITPRTQHPAGHAAPRVVIAGAGCGGLGTVAAASSATGWPGQLR